MTAYADTWEKCKIYLDGWGVLQEQNLSFMTVRVEQREGKRGWKDRVKSICFEFNPVRLMIHILRGKEKFLLFVLCDKQDRWLIIIMIMIILFWGLNNIRLYLTYFLERKLQILKLIKGINCASKASKLTVRSSRKAPIQLSSTY